MTKASWSVVWTLTCLGVVADFVAITAYVVGLYVSIGWWGFASVWAVATGIAAYGLGTVGWERAKEAIRSAALEGEL